MKENMNNIKLNNSYCTIIDNNILFHSDNFQKNIKIDDINSIMILKDKKRHINIISYIFILLLCFIIFFVSKQFQIILGLFSLFALIFSFFNFYKYKLIIKLKNQETYTNDIKKKEKENAKLALKMVNKFIKTQENKK
jgi:hypothetical protein